MPFEEIVGEHAVGIALAQGLVDAVTINALSVWARAGFQMMRDAAGGGEATFAEGAGNVGAFVGTGAKMLEHEVQYIYLRQFVGRKRVVHHAEIVGVVKFALTLRAVMLPMPKSVHMLFRRFPAAKIAIA